MKMIISPEHIDKLPSWLRVVSFVVRGLMPKYVRIAIGGFIEERIWVLALARGLNQEFRFDLQHVGMWWIRLSRGERHWASFMRCCAEEDAKDKMRYRAEKNSESAETDTWCVPVTPNDWSALIPA
jgi:hypothetical protein